MALSKASFALNGSVGQESIIDIAGQYSLAQNRRSFGSTEPLLFQGDNPPRYFSSIKTLYCQPGSDLNEGSLRYGFFRLAAFSGYQETL
jgi:hypothetical protein